MQRGTVGARLIWRSAAPCAILAGAVIACGSSNRTQDESGNGVTPLGADAGDLDLAHHSIRTRDASVATSGASATGGLTGSVDGGTVTSTSSIAVGTLSAEGGAAPGNTGLPTLPTMSNVNAVVSGNSATITFDPVAGAADYRVYALPDPSTVHLASDGSFGWIDNGTYRCAGQRAAPPVWIDDSPGPAFDGAPNGVPDWIAVDTAVDQADVENYTRPLSEATLGYAFRDPMPGTVPVYAVGDPSSWADNYGYGIRNAETRAKSYVTNNSAYLASGWRDAGVAFYAPDSAQSTACGGAAPVPVMTMDFGDNGYLRSPGNARLYFAQGGAEASLRATQTNLPGTPGPATTAFYVCPAQAQGALPVMRVFYRISSPGGSYGSQAGHDELVLGQQRFTRARCQGSTFGPCAGSDQSAWQVHWSNITAPTQLVVEALDAGCPFQGLFGANHVNAGPVATSDNGGNTSLMNDPILSLADLRSAATHGEVFLNGQHDVTASPHPIARAVIQVAPAPRPAMQFASDFANSPETFTEVTNSDSTPNCGLTQTLVTQSGTNDPQCDGAHHLSSSTYDALLFEIDNQRFTAGPSLGELWTGYSGGKFRVTPKNTTATLSDSSYLHAAMEVTSFSTGRRYPQIMISQQDMMTSQWLLERDTFGGPSVNPNIAPVVVLNPIDAGVGRHVVELELCNQRGWQVNDHCPWFLLEERDPPSPNTLGSWAGSPDLFDRFQDDRSVRYDLFLSTQKAYVFVDAQPYGCVDLAGRTSTDPSGTAITPTPAPPPAGPVTVTFGDAEYHAGAEPGYFQIYSPFHLEHELYETTRHFDYIAFDSNETAPPWDESAYPCVTQMHQGGNAGTQTPEQ